LYAPVFTMSAQVGTSSLPERLRCEAYAAMKASALDPETHQVWTARRTNVKLHAPDVSYTWHDGERERGLSEGGFIGLQPGGYDETRVWYACQI